MSGIQAPRLGVNIDHVATLRQARGGKEPDPVWAAVLAELGGAGGVKGDLRAERRHPPAPGGRRRGAGRRCVPRRGGPGGLPAPLRRARRHSQDRDLRLLRETVRVRLNLELAAEPEVVAIALAVRPAQVTFVTERRAELTTEGGLDVAGQADRVGEAVARCRDAGLEVS